MIALTDQDFVMIVGGAVGLWLLVVVLASHDAHGWYRWWKKNRHDQSKR